MKTTKKEQLKADLRTSLTIIRFLVEENSKVFGRKNMEEIEGHISQMTEDIEKF